MDEDIPGDRDRIERALIESGFLVGKAILLDREALLHCVGREGFHYSDLVKATLRFADEARQLTVGGIRLEELSKLKEGSGGDEETPRPR